MTCLSRISSPRGLASVLFAIVLGAAGGCASRPEAPPLERPVGSAAAQTASQLDALLPADVLLVGEQHDAAEHQQIEQQVVSVLASRRLLAALVLEMADAGVSTASLKPSATDEQTRRALRWDDKAWPWQAYGPAVMAAVRAGVPVLGANLPREAMPASMNDSGLDAQVPGPALKAQQQAIRIGHCDLLPESRIQPMTRVQIAKDMSMAATLGKAVLPGKTVVLLSGSGHADRTLGVPLHLPPAIKAKTILMQAQRASQAMTNIAGFDAVWATPALPETDYCDGISERFMPSSSSGDKAKP